ncbi:hypothetical protein COW94_00870 [Candidatus Peregrinibacteria bacterium CG22_combo_CG10-13_8_21_14_all_44_10]|nr:MAG: hypothetical protein AUK45_05435 [Candidatus Peregrinibacteria bacterium CG2_30_44_17]PIP66610.1 MAG: hypothetical protein COW94_00870 [Candidatus Peregrinibacteria bacterium CG22_combo_CG10-13_8_21_14_all_44_10]PIS04472.1 MAG: hypothetical protein COT83_00370 [Candidatus Peregrinibacteria bacterium CG10_big_fil_rev_8_21_14_0_10_44_7]PJB88722.1 MAG: hypothetical protein CO082_03510 [Candidatus Peregrinibacteria bacterium CG_4_9_14_0_8_um_filter_44_15]
MDIRLSWDLFIIVFFSVIIAYSFIIGKDKTLKVIIGTYLAILTADGLGNLFEQYLLPSIPSLAGPEGGQALILMKILVFIAVIVLITVKGGFSVDVLSDKTAGTRMLATFVFGVLNAGLIVSTILVFISGFSFVNGFYGMMSVTSLYQESDLVRMMVDNYNVWFSLPAIAFTGVSVMESGME